MNAEQQEILITFSAMLNAVSGDGQVKRSRGEKPNWKVDPAHEAAIFSHINRWKHGEKHDPDSGQHPLVHLAWRALAIAWQESQCSEPAPSKQVGMKILQDEYEKMRSVKGDPYITTRLLP